MTSDPLPMPLGCCDDFELSRMRVESTQLAPTMTTFASTCCSAPVLRSKYWTPLARPLSSTRMRPATAFDRISSRPVLSANRKEMIGGAEERRRVAAGPAVAAVVARRESAASASSCWRGGRRRPGCRVRRAAFCSSRSPQRGAGGGCRNLLPGSDVGIVGRRRRRQSAVRPGRSTARRRRTRSARGSPSRRARRP